MKARYERNKRNFGERSSHETNFITGYFLGVFCLNIVVEVSAAVFSIHRVRENCVCTLTFDDSIMSNDDCFAVE